MYPQWPLPATALHCDEVSPSVRDRITLLPNPASFVVGDVLWGATTADPAFALNTEEAAAPSAERGDRFAALARHCLDQRSFYPVFPPPLPPTNKAPGAAAETDQAARALPLEVTRVWHAGLPACPDVLLLPSRLGNPQARALGEHTVLVNPGALATRKTFARVAVFPDVPPPPGAPPFVTLRAQARVRVDIDKIA